MTRSCAWRRSASTSRALAVRAALGEPPAAAASSVRDRAGARALPRRPARALRRVEGLEEARALPGVLAYSYRAPGDTIEPLRVGADRAGFVLAAGETRAEAEAAAREAEATIRFLVG